MFNFLQKYLMGSMGKIVQFNIVRAVMASIPFTIVGSMFLVLNILPLPFLFLEGFFNVTFFKVSLISSVTDTEPVVSGIRMGAFIERLGTSEIFTAIIMSIIAP